MGGEQTIARPPVGKRHLVEQLVGRVGGGEGAQLAVELGQVVDRQLGRFEDALVVGVDAQQPWHYARCAACPVVCEVCGWRWSWRRWRWKDG